MDVSNLIFDIPLVQHSLGPPVRFTITDFSGNPIPLNNFTVNFFFKRYNDEYAVNAAHPECVIVDAANAIAEYSFVSGDLAETGTYFGDVQLVSGDIDMVSGVSGYYEETAPQVVRFIVRESNMSKVKPPPRRRRHNGGERLFAEEMRALILTRNHDERLINDIVFGGLPPPKDTRKMKHLREKLKRAMAHAKPPEYNSFQVQLICESMRLELEIEREMQVSNIGNFEVE